MRNDCSLRGGWCLKALTRGEYINSRMSILMLLQLSIVGGGGGLTGRRMLTKGVGSKLSRQWQLWFDHFVDIVQIRSKDVMANR